MDRQRPPFTLEQMRTFLAVADRESVTHAAHSLGLTRGAITQQLQLLEKALGVRLLERVGRTVRLTNAGRTIAASCRAAARGIDAVVESAHLAASGEAGSVHMGASQTAASHYVAAPLAAFVGERPNVRLQVTVGTTASICEEVELGILDVGCVEDPLPPLPAESVSKVQIAEDEVVLVARTGHPLTRGRHLGVGDLAGHRLLAREPGSAVDAVARQVLGPSFQVISRLELGALDAVRAAALAGIGFAIIPRVAVADELERGGLRQLDFPPHLRGIRAIRRRAELSPTVEAFWAVLTARP